MKEIVCQIMDGNSDATLLLLFFLYTFLRIYCNCSWLFVFEHETLQLLCDVRDTKNPGIGN